MEYGISGYLTHKTFPHELDADKGAKDIMEIILK